jgi:hypothetical protein
MRWLKIFGFIGALALISHSFYGGRDGLHVAYKTSNCGDEKIRIWTAYYWRGFELGDEYGYGMMLITPGRAERPLYLGGAYHTDPSNLALGDFAPLPPDSIGMTTRVFELPDRTYDRNAPPISPGPHEPRLLNIFLDPAKFQRTEFTGIVACLEKNRDHLNKALVELASAWPERVRKSYYPQRLGGVVYGKPPYDDSRYIEAIHAVWGISDPPPEVIAVPESGRFTILPGQRAESTIDGFDVSISIPPEGGEPVKSIDPPLPSKPPFVLQYISRHSDKSATFGIAQRGADGLYRE